jgi:tyrosyl-tRNA synthetase
VHGESGLSAATKATERLNRGEFSALTESELLEVLADVPNKALSHDRLAGEGLWIVDAVREAGLGTSNGEVRRIIDQGGLYVNGTPWNDATGKLNAGNLLFQSILVLSVGKKQKKALLRFV